jgi:hypothetical protein
MEQTNVRQKSNCLTSTKFLTPTEKGRRWRVAGSEADLHRDSDCSISGGGTSPVAITGAAPRPRRHRHSQDAIGLYLSSLFSSNLTSP